MKKDSKIFIFSMSFFLCFIIAIYIHPCSSPLPEENSYPLLYSKQNRDDLEKIFLRAIDGAKESIMVAVFNLSDGKITQALKKRAEEGIKVTVIYDKKASKGISKKLGDKIHLAPRHHKGHMHLKILLIDKKKIWIGSANMTWESLHMHDNLVVGIQDFKIGEFISEKLQDLIQGKTPKTSEALFNAGKQKIHFFFLPEKKKSPNEIISLIHNAQKSLIVAMFTWTRMDFANAVIQASKRGVDIKVFIDSNSAKGCGKQVVKELSREGIQVNINQGLQLLHHKFLYVDERDLLVGSANWTKSAFQNNDDCFLILHDLSKEQKKAMNNTYKILFLESIEISNDYEKYKSNIESCKNKNSQLCCALLANEFSGKRYENSFNRIWKYGEKRRKGGLFKKS